MRRQRPVDQLGRDPEIRRWVERRVEPVRSRATPATSRHLEQHLAERHVLTPPSGARPARPGPARRRDPSAGASAAATLSLITSPPVMSMSERIFSASTSSPASSSRTSAAADPVSRSSAGSVSHSACHVPAPRSCSCAIAPSIVATSPGARCAHATQPDRADRVALVRHRRGAAATLAAALGRLGHLGLREQHDVASDLAQ